MTSNIVREVVIILTVGMALNRLQSLFVSKLCGLNICSTTGINASGCYLPLLCTKQNIHISASCSEPKKWPQQNEIVYPIQKPDEPRRLAWVCHCRNNIKYSPKKMLYIACLVRGMSVEEAVKQLSFIPKKGAVVVKEVIQEAAEMAVREHNVEFKTNLWVAQSLVSQGLIVKGVRKHARMRFGTVYYRYCHYFVRLAEGPPPEHYYERPLTGNEKLQEYFDELRQRRIMRTL